jgi:hypothetical protein
MPKPSRKPIQLTCPFCAVHPLWAYHDQGGVYLACANPEEINCPDATPVVPSIALATRLAERMTIKVKAAIRSDQPGHWRQLELFGRYSPVRPPKRQGGYAATPGTGPKGETCKTCIAYRPFGRYAKCLKIKSSWTHGKASDILARSPACREWQAKTDPVKHEEVTK